MRTLSAADFISATPPPALGGDEIHLWIFPQCGVGRSTTADTQRRLHETLAAYLGVEADEVRVERDAAGKPFLADLALQFNLSHSGGIFLIGLSRSQPLGVDVESGKRQRPFLDIARRYFTADEAAALSALPAGRLAHGFLELWSAKEAVLKAIGRGIAFGLDRIGFALDAMGVVQGLSHLDEEAGTPAQWQVVRLALDNAIGAIAWRGPEMKLRVFTAADSPASATVRATSTS